MFSSVSLIINHCEIIKFLHKLKDFFLMGNIPFTEVPCILADFVKEILSLFLSLLVRLFKNFIYS